MMFIPLIIMNKLKDTEMAQKIRSLAALTGEPRFTFQKLDSNSQQSVTSIPGDSTKCSDLCRYLTHTWCSYIHAGKALILIK